MIQTTLFVALGGAIGAACRFLVTIGASRLFGLGFPWGTITVNVFGSFLMGALVIALEAKGGTRFAPFLMSGILGGFTTFSAFSLDAVALFQRGAVLQAGGYVFGSVIVAILALLAGMAVARGILA